MFIRILCFFPSKFSSKPSLDQIYLNLKLSFQYTVKIVLTTRIERPPIFNDHFETLPTIFSSPEPKTQGELIVYQSSRCLSVDIFKLEYLCNQWANRNKILTEPSLGWGKDCIRFWARSDRNSGVRGNG